jgi:hypothetical protein
MVHSNWVKPGELPPLRLDILEMWKTIPGFPITHGASSTQISLMINKYGGKMENTAVCRRTSSAGSQVCGSKY